MTQLLPPKKEVALALLERSNVDVYLDPRATRVVVPPQFRKEPRLILKIGLNMPVPIHDLHVDDDTMSCTLSFNRSPFYCVVPWSSVFAMVGEDGRGMVWPDDVPQELAVKVVDPNDPQAGRTSPSGPTGRLTAVESVGSSNALSSPASAASAGLGRRNGRSRIAGTDDAAASADTSSTSGTSRGKRKKKKEEEGTRPLLVAVPREPDASARAEDESAVNPDQPHENLPAPEQRRPQPSQPSQPSQAAQPKDGVSPVAHAPPQTGRSGPRQPVQQPVRRPPPVRPTDGEARPKRELPPYLRVVK